MVNSTGKVTSPKGMSAVPLVPATGTPPTVHVTVAGVTPGSPPPPKPTVRTPNWLKVDVAKVPLRTESPQSVVVFSSSPITPSMSSEWLPRTISTARAPPVVTVRSTPSSPASVARMTRGVVATATSRSTDTLGTAPRYQARGPAFGWSTTECTTTPILAKSGPSGSMPRSQPLRIRYSTYTRPTPFDGSPGGRRIRRHLPVAADAGTIRALMSAPG